LRIDKLFPALQAVPCEIPMHVYVCVWVAATGGSHCNANGRRSYFRHQLSPRHRHRRCLYRKWRNSRDRFVISA